MLVDEDDFTIIKIYICLTWQPPIMVSVILAELELNISQFGVKSEGKKCVEGGSYEMFDMRYFR